MIVNLEDLTTLALAAGREIMAVRAAGFDTQTKLDGSPVTIADQRAEAVIEAGLKRLAPDIPMLGEEAVAAGRIPECGDLFFCVDPLDGTRGFAKGRDEFTVNIALVERGEAILGVVYAPATGELYYGEPGRAERVQCDVATATPRSAPTRIVTPPQPPGGVWRIALSEQSGRNDRTKRFLTTLNGLATHASSSIKFCRVAEGTADLYPRFGDVSEWDAAAGHAILAAAGGGVMTLDGAPLHYGAARERFLIHGFIAFAGAAAASAARGALQA